MSERLTARAWFDVWMMTVDAAGSARAKIGLVPTLARKYLVGAAEERHGRVGASKAGEMFDTLLKGTADLSTGKMP